MQTVTIGIKYQIVIPKEVRRKIPGITPGRKVTVKPADTRTILIKPMPQDWVKQTQGIAKKAWKGIDTTKYLEELRNEWNR